MSTSAYIITKHNGYYWGAMCNWDGYPDGLGSDLLNMTMADKNSNTIEQQIFDTIKNGDMSYLGEPYMEEGSEAYKFKSLKTMLRNIVGCFVDYIYLYNCEQWYVARAQYDVDVIDFYRLSLFFKNNNPQEFKGEDYQEHIFRDKTPDNIITIRSK